MNNKGSDSYKNIYMTTGFICAFIGILLVVIVISLVVFGSFGKGSDVLDESSAPEISVPVVEESSVPEISEVEEETLASQIVFEQLVVNNLSVYEGKLAVISAENAPAVPSDELYAFYKFGSEGSAYSLSGVRIKVREDARTQFDAFLAAFSEAVPNTGLIIDKGYEKAEDLSTSDLSGGYVDLASGYSVKFSLLSSNYNFSSTELAYLYEQAYKFGIIRRYSDNKETVTGFESNPRLYRYIGIAHTQYMSTYNLSLEEYIDVLKSSTEPREYVSSLEDNTAYIVYYVPMSEGDDTTLVNVPADAARYPYDISGDGSNGFIVTVKVSLSE